MYALEHLTSSAPAAPGGSGTCRPRETRLSSPLKVNPGIHFVGFQQFPIPTGQVPGLPSAHHLRPTCSWRLETRSDGDPVPLPGQGGGSPAARGSVLPQQALAPGGHLVPVVGSGAAAGEQGRWSRGCFCRIGGAAGVSRDPKYLKSSRESGDQPRPTLAAVLGCAVASPGSSCGCAQRPLFKEPPGSPVTARSRQTRAVCRADACPSFHRCASAGRCAPGSQSPSRQVSAWLSSFLAAWHRRARRRHPGGPGSLRKTADSL